MTLRPTGLIGSSLSRPGNIQPGGDLPMPSAVPFGRFVPVDRLDDYWVSVWSFMRRHVAGVGHLYLAEYDAAGGLLALTEFGTLDAVETGWTRHSLHMGPNDQLGRRAFQIDTAKVKVVAWADGTPDMTWDLDGWQAERGKVLTAYAPRPQELVDQAVDRTQIADDAITTPKLVANAVVAGKIAAGAITAEKIAADAVTADKISAGAIDTEHLAATATIKRVSNDGAEVVIDGSGLTVTGGAITVHNPGGTVVIDGTSNMFKIAATGTLATPDLGAAGNSQVFVNLATGFTYRPMTLTQCDSSSGSSYPTPVLTFDGAGAILDHLRTWVNVVNGNQTQVVADSWTKRATGLGRTYNYRYYVLKEAGI